LFIFVLDQLGHSAERLKISNSVDRNRATVAHKTRNVLEEHKSQRTCFAIRHMRNSGKTFLEPDLDSDHHTNLIILY